MTETELVAACLQNNRVAQRTLYDRYKRAMYTLAYRLTGDFDDANDVLQDAFLDIFRKLETYRAEATLGAWIKTIVVRKAYQKLQKPKQWELIEEITEDSMIDWGSAIDAEYLEKAIQSLPEGFRMVFILIEVEGYSHKETAEILGISEGTSKSQLFHAKKKLRGILNY
ncbi:RNA polymerase sigma factor [Emticicia sp. 17c]|uniref:RNA polymerase sigma factor n=1 Tax=Emticicia sp. 17c TaxID=3127704 RepID=UPI00301C0F72